MSSFDEAIIYKSAIPGKKGLGQKVTRKKRTSNKGQGGKYQGKKNRNQIFEIAN